jgi:hypothetical protein
MWSLGRPDAPSDEPVLIVGERVTAATEEVLEAGVSLGMPRREAEALAPFATVLVRDPGEESRRFEPVVETIEDLIPRVEVVTPGLVFVPIAGAVRFYGGEEVLAERVVKELGRSVGQERGGHVLVGIADGPFAARWAAAGAEVGSPLVVDDTISFLSNLDLAALREGLEADELIDTFRWLGVSTLAILLGSPEMPWPLVLATRVWQLTGWRPERTGSSTHGRSHQIWRWTPASRSRWRASMPLPSPPAPWLSVS